jgi:nitrite reductase/ring-hydroxylating ferredoxin subunit
MLSKEDNALITRVSPGTPMGSLFRRYWLPALLSSDCPEADCPPVRLRLLGEDLVAFRTTSGQPAVLDTYCPHRNANLFWGRNEDEGLRCIYHGWKFNAQGACVDMPNEPPGSRFAEKIKHAAVQQQCRPPADLPGARHGLWGGDLSATRRGRCAVSVAAEQGQRLSDRSAVAEDAELHGHSRGARAGHGGPGGPARPSVRSHDRASRRE